MLIPVAVAIWWLWSRGYGQKAKRTMGLLADGAKYRNDSRSSGGDTEEASGYELFECWPETVLPTQQDTGSQQDTSSPQGASIERATEHAVSSYVDYNQTIEITSSLGR